MWCKGLDFEEWLEQITEDDFFTFMVFATNGL